MKNIFIILIINMFILIAFTACANTHKDDIETDNISIMSESDEINIVETVSETEILIEEIGLEVTTEEEIALEILSVEPVLNELLLIEFDPSSMPAPFLLSDGGGNLNMMLFTMLGTNSARDAKIDGIPMYIREAFVDDDSFLAWIENSNLIWNYGIPVSSLMEYPNLFSFIISFNIPVNKLREVMNDIQFKGMELEAEDGRDRSSSYFTDEEIDIILSLDEARILEHFISDYAIFHEGRGFTPAWIYWHSAEDYKTVGITAEMLEEKLDLYSEFSFTLEATLAFEEKLSEFMGVDVVLDTAARSSVNNITSSVNSNIES
jgi:hypothetical protein